MPPDHNRRLLLVVAALLMLMIVIIVAATKPVLVRQLSSWLVACTSVRDGGVMVTTRGVAPFWPTQHIKQTLEDILAAGATAPRPSFVYNLRMARNINVT